ncbi:hypothetical protein L3i23_04520 [Herbiconiux sp. L3-i23]|nr:hypothetical protein L3i23_04520 [Herbiconiux sp. L3-i23]
MVLVARRAGEYLDQTLAALAAQTRRPDRIVLVELGSDPRSAALQNVAGVERMVAPDSLSFGDAVEAATRVLPPAQSGDEWLWLLSADNAPSPDALAALLAEVEISPSVAIAAPKQMQAADPTYLYSFGETMTPSGTAVELAEPELDQAQYDRESDVLGAAAGGLLVRTRLWQELEGFDPGLPAVDDALDFCVRARLAGHRVVLVPGARVLSAGRHAPGTAHLGARTSRAKKARLARAAGLHRRMAYAPAWAVPLHWLSLVPLALVRAIGQLLGKRPGRVLGEFAAAFSVAFAHAGSIVAARRRIARGNVAGWKSIAALRLPWQEVRRRRALTRDEATSARRADRYALDFFSGGGVWTVVGAAILGVIVSIPLFGFPTVAAPGLLPLGSVGDLWGAVGYGWRGAGAGFVGAADPFAWVIAVLGSLTAWAPSASILALYFAALPLAALGAWFAAARLTPRPGLRLLAAAAWTLAPTLLVALADGRLGAVIAHLLLPWLAFALSSARRSWAAAATSGLLAAAIAASAPSLLPALLALWLVAVIGFAAAGRRGRGWHRLVPLPLPAVVLFAPLALQQFLRGTPLAVFADPGVPVPTPAAGSTLLERIADAVSLLALQPDALRSGLDPLIGAFGIEAPTLLLPAVLALPLLLTALAAPFLARPLRAVGALGVAATGFLSASVAGHLVLATSGGDAVTVWPGSGLSLYGFGVVGAAVIALDQGSARAASIVRGVVGGVAALGVVIAALPLLLLSVQAGGAVGGAGSTVPALVSAEAANDPSIGTLVIDPAKDGIAARLERGAGGLLDEQSTLYATSRTGALSAADEQVAVLAGNLASRSGYDSAVDLDALRIGFVLLGPATGEDSAVRDRVAAALDANSAFTPVTTTALGTLWRYVGLDAGLPPAVQPVLTPAQHAVGLIVIVSQLLVLGSTLLLALPTGALAERVRPEREVRRGSGRARRAAVAAATQKSDVTDADATDVLRAPAPDGEPASPSPSGTPAETKPDEETARVSRRAEPDDSDARSFDDVDREPRGDDEYATIRRGGDHGA